MGESELEGTGREPGADLGDDGDVPADPLLGGETGSEPGASEIGGEGGEAA